MAWTRQLSSGKYQGCYRDALGREQSAGTFTQRPKALREASRLESEQREPGAVDVEGGKITWGAWFELWHESRNLSYATDDCYRSTADNHITPHWGKVPLKDITTLEVSKWVKGMLKPRRRTERKRSPWTVRNALMLLKTSLNAAVEAKRLGANPAKPVPYPDLPEGVERYLTPDEVEGITFYMDGFNALIVWLGVNTGLRFGELAGLHWNRIDFDRKVIHVVEQFNQKSRTISPLKDKQRRTVPLPADLTGKLLQYREHAARGRGSTCGLTHDISRCGGDLLFRGARGAPIKSNDWGKTIWRKALDLAGVEGRVRPHDMRHTYASWLIQEGVSVAELAELMGHSSWEITKMYAHLSDTGFDGVRDALDRRRGKVTPVEPAVPAVDVEVLAAQLADMQRQLSVLKGYTAPIAADMPRTPEDYGGLEIAR
ncbi:tyrosine-type recombinase/integrase [Amycolatopsis sp. NPDC006125]|uniref:tyrosine-type recombinase/integrase n=1 Tax=Amycolatopsis sp. NPDC006125 TaxID=3156730 RepID=UPI0033AD996A